MSLTFVKPTEAVNFNVLLYGPPKTGKSMGAASAPGPVLYANADRANATRLVHATYGDKIHEVHIDSLETLLAVQAEAANPKWRTVIIDPLSEVYRVMVEQFSNRAMNPHLNNYGDAGTHLERFCRAVTDLPVNFVMVAYDHTFEQKGEAPMLALPYTGSRSNPVLGQKIMGMVDVLGYTGVAQPPRPEGQPETAPPPDPVYMAQLIDGNGRRGGTRWPELGITRAVNLTEWDAVIRAAEEVKKNQPATPADAPKEAIAA
jgi:hypothetical protein